MPQLWVMLVEFIAADADAAGTASYQDQAG